MTTTLGEPLTAHLARDDGQEDLTFAVYRVSTGASRTTALLVDLVLPEAGERLLHGNASFTSSYFLRAAGRAAEAGLGLALLHAHPGAAGWQDLSGDDAAAERGHAAQTWILTGRPLLGMTCATGDQSYSARFWPRVNGEVTLTWAESVRVITQGCARPQATTRARSARSAPGARPRRRT
jgi:hypothetical protein